MGIASLAEDLNGLRNRLIELVTHHIRFVHLGTGMTQIGDRRGYVSILYIVRSSVGRRSWFSPTDLFTVGAESAEWKVRLTILVSIGAGWNPFRPLMSSPGRSCVQCTRGQHTKQRIRHTDSQMHYLPCSLNRC